jgi:copper chaperone CopZ
MDQLTLRIGGMTCEHCVEQVTTALTRLTGVKIQKVAVGEATVISDPQVISSAQIARAINDAGYELEMAGITLPGVRKDIKVMDHHDHHQHHQSTLGKDASLTSLAFSATAHCLTGCAIGEVLGMVVGTYWGLSNMTTVALSVILAFVFGYLLTLKPLVRNGMALRTALGLAFASDTLSIATMEVIDNAVMLIIPGAMDAGLGTVLFWGSLAVSLVLAFFAAVPVNRWLLSKGRGHALVHQYHHAH